MRFDPKTVLEEYYGIILAITKNFADLLVKMKKPILGLKPLRRAIQAV